MILRLFKDLCDKKRTDGYFLSYCVWINLPDSALLSSNIKGALCSLGEDIQTQNDNICNLNEGIVLTNVYFLHNWLNKLLYKGPQKAVWS